MTSTVSNHSPRRHRPHGRVCGAAVATVFAALVLMPPSTGAAQMTMNPELLQVLPSPGSPPLGAPSPRPSVSDPAALVNRAAGWCVQGATLTVMVSIVVGAPALIAGAAVPLGAAELANFAGSGCGFGIIWGSVVSGTYWIADQLFPQSTFQRPPPGLPVTYRG